MECYTMMKRIFRYVALSIGILGSLCSYISTAPTWYELKQIGLSTVYGDLAWKAGGLLGIRCALLHIPDKVEDTRPIAIIAIHGTFAAESREYSDNAIYFVPALKACAEEFAQKEKAPVKVIFYRWSGYDNDDSRKEAGKKLAHIIDHYHGYKIITVAHSHGGNVVNYASNLIRSKIDLMLHFAVPVIYQNDLYTPHNFKALYNFYSTNDIVQLLGATDAHKSFEGIRRRWWMPSHVYRNYSLGKAGKVINIDTSINGYEADHSDIKNIISVVPRCVALCEKKYPHHNHFYLNVDIRQKLEHQVIVTIKESNKEAPEELVYSQEQKCIYKKLYNREIDSLKPRFAALYSTVMNALLLLPHVRDLCERYRWYKAAPYIALA